VADLEHELTHYDTGEDVRLGDVVREPGETETWRVVGFDEGLARGWRADAQRRFEKMWESERRVRR